MKVDRCPSDELSLTNCAFVNPNDFPNSVEYVLILYFKIICKEK